MLLSALKYIHSSYSKLQKEGTDSYFYFGNYDLYIVGLKEQETTHLGVQPYFTAQLTSHVYEEITLYHWISYDYHKICTALGKHTYLKLLITTLLVREIDLSEVNYRNVALYNINMNG